MVERKKSLLVAKRSNECLLNNAKELKDDLAICENKYQGSSNPANVDQARTLVTKLATNLREMKGDLQFHELLLRRESTRVKDGEIELKDVHKRLQKVSKDLDVLELKGGQTKKWVQTLGFHVQLMSRGEESLLVHCQLKIPPPWLLIHLEFILPILA